MQRRRKPRSKPRDVFSKSGNPQKRPVSESPKVAPKTPPAASKPVQLPASPPVSQDSKQPDDAVAETRNEQSTQEENIMGEQLIGETRKGIGLRSSELEEVKTEDSDLQTSKRAQDIIDKSKARASEHQRKKVTSKEAQKPAPAPVKRRRRVKPSFQPAERKKRLDRSRHMEYKYEVRRLLVEINVQEEHRSSILGSVWAKGERQTVADAKEFLSEKFGEGILDEKQLEAMTRVVDNYTVRR